MQDALSAYLKAIERRGGMASAESHLEVGLIYLNHSKDPFEAYHHFHEYLAQQPNSRDAKRVTELLNTAKREAVRAVGQSPDNPSLRADLLEQNESLKREIEALRSEIRALRQNADAPIRRETRVPLTIEPPAMRPVVPDSVAPVIPVEEPSPIMPAPQSSSVTTGLNSAPSQTRPTAPTRPNPQTSAPPAPNAGAMRRHVVVQGDSLYGLAKKYYGTANNAKAEAIFEANRDVMKNHGDLRPGMELKIP